MTELTIKDKAGCKTAAALGIFDGLHAGHSAVIGRAVSEAQDRRISPAVFTFRTASVTTKGSGYKPIYNDMTKLRLLEEKGIEFVFMPEFESLRCMSPDEFAGKILKGVLNAEAAVCGRDFRMGKNASCGTDELSEICSKLGIKLIVVDDITDSDTGHRISSAEIRRLISEGDIISVNRMMGHDYTVCGEIITGNRFGRQMNFPTANQMLSTDNILPKFGVYASYAEIDGKVYRGVTNIGVKPTVDNSGVPLAETHFPSFSGDLYGRDLSVKLIRFVRSEIRFSGVEELKNQISEDTQTILDMKYPFDTDN